MPLGHLSFRARHDVESAHDVADGVVLRGELEWFVTGLSIELDAVAKAVGAFGERASEGALLLRFGNAVGRFRVADLGMLEVRCGKWSEETFDAMLEDLTRVALALPFSATQAAGLPHDRALADRDDVLLHAFLYARHIVLTTSRAADTLGSALSAVLRDPHRRFMVEREKVHLGNARRADARTLFKIAAGTESLMRSSVEMRETPLARALAGQLPEFIDEPRVLHSVDTAENRFVRALLMQVVALVDRVEQIAVRRRQPSFWARLVEDCGRMRVVLTPFLRHGMWNEVGAMTHVPLASSVLQRRRGYKDVLRHHLTLRAAACLPVDGAVMGKQLLGMKDVAALYELWCYFAVVRELETILGAPTRAGRPSAGDVQVGVDWGLSVAWASGVEVFYNLSFSRGASAERRSASLLLRPDIVIKVPSEEGPAMHVLDAKLRVQATGPADRDEDDCVEESLRFKRADVAKMHAYRDALPSVRSAFILYPGDEAVTFPALDPRATAADAIGAIPLVPGGEPVHLHRWLRAIVASMQRRQC